MAATLTEGEVVVKLLPMNFHIAGGQGSDVELGDGSFGFRVAVASRLLSSVAGTFTGKVQETQ